MKGVFVLLASWIAVSQANSIVGGWSELTPNTGVYNRAVLVANMKINEMSNDLYYKKVVEVISVKSQVVSGIMYEVKMRMGLTKCLKPEVNFADVEQSCDVTAVSSL